MAELTVDLTYGTALYEAAKDTGKVELIMNEADAVLEIFKSEPELFDFINYPAISAIEKKDVLEKIFGGKISEELLNFICILVDKRRSANFEKMIKVYKKLMEKEEGLSYGTVYSVKPLSQERMKELEEEASKLFGANVRLTNEIDPKLMGGIKILVEGKIIDASIRTKFDELGSQIKKR
jgi:ATP synthase F1 delta subunit